MNLPFLAFPGLGAMATMERRLWEVEGGERKSLLLRNWREFLGLEDKLKEEGVRREEHSFLGIGEVMEDEDGAATKGCAIVEPREWGEDREWGWRMNKARPILYFVRFGIGLVANTMSFSLISISTLI